MNTVGATAKTSSGLKGESYVGPLQQVAFAIFIIAGLAFAFYVKVLQ